MSNSGLETACRNRLELLENKCGSQRISRESHSEPPTPRKNIHLHKKQERPNVAYQLVLQEVI